MEQSYLPIVIVGHVDHGKSTLIGRLFYDTGCLPKDKLEDIKKRSEELGRELEWAFIMDHLEEERRRGITIDIAHTFFKTDKRKYIIIDAPGHREFLKNMITGTTQAEAALFLVDVSEGIKDQTSRHCFILSLLGIEQVVVVVNKMDLVDYDECRFNSLVMEIKRLMEDNNIKAEYIVPISSKYGDNIANRSSKMDWYAGPTVLEILDRLEEIDRSRNDLRFPIQDVYHMNGKRIIVGRVESGVMKKGDKIKVFPEGKAGIIKEIIKFGIEHLESATKGESIGVVVSDGIELERGEVVAKFDDDLHVEKNIRARIFWLDENPYRKNMELVLRISTQEKKCFIKEVFSRFDPAKMVKMEGDELESSEVADVLIETEGEMVAESFNKNREFGRFVLESDGYPVAGGIII